MPDLNFRPDWPDGSDAWDMPGIRVDMQPAGGIFLVAARKGAALPSAFGLVWPSEAGLWVGDSPGVTLIAPNRWLVACALVQRPAVAAELLAPAMAPRVHVHDVSDGRVWITVRGPRAAELLNCGIAVDLDSGSFPPGTAASVQLSQTSVLLHRQEEDGFRLLADASYGSYLRSWFERNLPLVAAAPAATVGMTAGKSGPP